MGVLAFVLVTGQAAARICASITGSARDLCVQQSAQSASLPGAATAFLIVIIVGGVVAAAGGALMLVRNRAASPALGLGGILVLLFAIIFGANYLFVWELIIALVCGVLALAVGVLAVIPQTSQSMGLPSPLAAGGAGAPTVGAHQQPVPGAPQVFGAAGQQWQGQPQQWGAQPQQPPPPPPAQWGAQPQQPPQWPSYPPQQQNYPPPQR
jgi:hypothetical protein